ncbi:MAG: DUF6455 family protein [Acetobacteraceae bacterium]
MTQIKAAVATTPYRSAHRTMEDAMAQTTQQQRDHGLVARALDWLFARGGAAGTPLHMSDADLRYMANDLGISVADLMDVVPRAPDNTVLMDRMMRARGLDPAAIRRMPAALVRDLEMTCTRCGDTGRCRRDLDAGTAAANCHAYCGNAVTFDAILEDRAAP